MKIIMGKQILFSVFVLSAVLVQLTSAVFRDTPNFKLRKDDKSWKDVLQDDVMLENTKTSFDEKDEDQFQVEEKNDSPSLLFSDAKPKNRTKREPAELINVKEWVMHTRQNFGFLTELEKTKLITKKMINGWIIDLAKAESATAAEVLNIADKSWKYWGKLGVNDKNSVNVDEFLKRASKLGMQELAKKRKNLPTVRGQLDAAWFNILDENNDGILTVDELAIALNATDVDAKYAGHWLESMDADKDGSVTLKEYTDHYFASWFGTKLINDKNWVAGMDKLFGRFVKPLEKKLISMKTVRRWVGTYAKACNASPAEILQTYAAARNFWGKIGVNDTNSLNLTEFVKGASKLGMEDLANKRNNQPTARGQLDAAYFKMIDQNDDGFVTVDELTILMSAFGKAEKTERFFKLLDHDKNEKVSLKEYDDTYFRFWYGSKLQY